MPNDKLDFASNTSIDGMWAGVGRAVFATLNDTKNTEFDHKKNTLNETKKHTENSVGDPNEHKMRVF